MQTQTWIPSILGSNAVSAVVRSRDTGAQRQRNTLLQDAVKAVHDFVFNGSGYIFTLSFD